MKKIPFILSLISLSVTNFAVADSVNIENPDKMNVKIYFGSNLKADSNNDRVYFEGHPKKDEDKIRVLINKGDFLNKSLISSSNSWAQKGCNYAIIATKKNGWKIVNTQEGTEEANKCSPSEDNWKEKAVYTITNNSEIPIYPSFAHKGAGFAPDSVDGWLKPNNSRLYSEDTKYWKAVNIKNGTEIKTGIFDSSKQEYIECSGVEPVNNTKNYIFDGKTCSKK